MKIRYLLSNLSVITTISIKELNKYKETQSKIYEYLFSPISREE